MRGSRRLWLHDFRIRFYLITFFRRICVTLTKRKREGLLNFCKQSVGDQEDGDMITVQNRGLAVRPANGEDVKEI